MNAASEAGYAYPGNVGFQVELPNRKSFSPDAAFYTGPATGMKFIEAAPDFAIEVRSEQDYGAAAEEELLPNRDDYFAAGTKVVRDVDTNGPDIIRVVRCSWRGRSLRTRRDRGCRDRRSRLAVLGRRAI